MNLVFNCRQCALNSIPQAEILKTLKLTRNDLLNAWKQRCYYKTLMKTSIFILQPHNNLQDSQLPFKMSFCALNLVLKSSSSTYNRFCQKKSI